MRNRLFRILKEARRRRRKLFCAFLTLGYPNLAATRKLIHEFEAAGVDLLELGFPFSDPLADGPTIQFSSERALAKGVRFRDAFATAQRLRREGCGLALIFFSYLNPIYRYGFPRFVRKAKASGFDGLIVPDLPPEAEAGLRRACRRYGLPQIFLVAPTTTPGRARRIGRSSQGFVYYVSLRGVTGARKSLAGDVRKTLKRFRKAIRRPLLVGFGVSSPAQGRAVARASEGVIVGSAILDHLRRSPQSLKPAIRFVERMVKSVKG